jgi:hypothetical protein
MSGYKENQIEVKERTKYSREYQLGIFFIVTVISALFSLAAIDSKDSIFKIFLSINHSWEFNLFAFIVSIGVYIWWRNKKKNLDVFFFKPVKNFNGINYPKDGFKLLSYKDKDVLSIFDFNPKTMKRADSSSTHKIIKLFRDDILEDIEQKAPQKKQSYLKKYDGATPSQESNFTELFLAIEGVLREYKQLKTKVIAPPLFINTKTKEIVLRKTEVYNGQDKLFFSYTMIEDTLKTVTHLFYNFANKQLKIKNSTRLFTEHPNSLELKDLDKIVDIFKLVYLRRLLSNYSSMPAGWFVIRIEDYDTRAILSAVDRPMIPIITPQNDGSSVAFESDTWAAAWLYLYWSFMSTPQIKHIVKHIDWSFNTTKDINDIKMHEFAEMIKGKQ